MDPAADAPAMSAASITAVAHPIVVDFVPRIPLGSELRLRDMPPVLGAVHKAVRAGATRVELDATCLCRFTEGAMELLEGAKRRLNDDHIELVMVG